MAIWINFILFFFFNNSNLFIHQIINQWTFLKTCEKLHFFFYFVFWFLFLWRNSLTNELQSVIMNLTRQLLIFFLSFLSSLLLFIHKSVQKELFNSTKNFVFLNESLHQSMLVGFWLFKFLEWKRKGNKNNN